MLFLTQLLHTKYSFYIFLGTQLFSDTIKLNSCGTSVANGFIGNLGTDEVLGDLTREEALRFVIGGKDSSSGKEWPGLISNFEEIPPLRKEDWEKVWAMCGGNIHLLLKCVSKACVFKDWGEAVKRVGAAPEKNVKLAWTNSNTVPERMGGEDDVWTSKDYRIAVALIAAAAPYHAVSQAVLEAEMEGNGGSSRTGAKILNSMVECGVLSVRPYSYLAKDIPRDAFVRTFKRNDGIKVEETDSLAMIPSLAHLQAALTRNSKWNELKRFQVFEVLYTIFCICVYFLWAQLVFHWLIKRLYMLLYLHKGDEALCLLHLR